MIKASTKYTKETTMRFVKFSEFRSTFQIVTYIVLEMIMLAMGSLLIITSENTTQLILSIAVIAPILLLVIPITLTVMPLIISSTNKNMIDCVNEYEFGEEGMRVKSNLPSFSGESVIEYKFIENVCETEESFYLFISKQQAYIINKTDITEGTASELHNLLMQNIPKNKYSVRKKGMLTVLLIAAVSIAVIIGSTVYAYSNPYQEKSNKMEFSRAGMTITLSDEFHEKEMVSFAATYDSENIAVFVIKDEYTFAEDNELALTEFAELVIQSNSLEADVKIVDGLTAFSYVKQANGKEYNYFSTVYKGKDAFWVLQFACETSKYKELETSIMEYAKSVVV